MNPRILVPSKEEKEREEDFELVRSIARETGLPTTWIGILHQWNRPSLWKELMARTNQAFREGLLIYPQASCRTIQFRFTLRNLATIFDDLPKKSQLNPCGV